MRKGDDREKKKEKKEKKEKREKNGENSGPLTSLPVDRLNSDRLQRRPLVPITSLILLIDNKVSWLTPEMRGCKTKQH